MEDPGAVQVSPGRYDRTSHVGKLGKALAEATARGFMVVDMKAGWKRVFPFDK
jgi:hypothetical protein